MKLAELSQTCAACPAQWEGRLEDGRPIYVRYRFGYLSVSVGPVGGNINDAVCGEEIYGMVEGDKWDGDIDEEKMLELTGLEK